MNTKQAVPKQLRHILLNVPPEMYTEFRSNCVNENSNMRAKLLQLMELYNEEKRNKESHRQIKRFLAMTKEEREAIGATATKKAIAETHALGIPTTHGDEKGIYQLYPDGHREYIERYEEKEKHG